MTNVKAPKITIEDRGEGVIMLGGVQLSFPNLWKPGTHKGKVKASLDSQLVIPKDQKEIAVELNKLLLTMARTVAPDTKKLSDTLNCKLNAQKDKEKKPTGNYTLSVTNQFDYPPKYYDHDGKAHEYTGGPESDVPSSVVRKLRAGNYVNAMIQTRAQMIDGEVKVWTNLAGIQFAQTGPNLGGGVSEEVMDGAFGAVVNEFEDSGSDEAEDVAVDDEFDDDEFEL